MHISLASSNFENGPLVPGWRKKTLQVAVDARQNKHSGFANVNVSWMFY